jgi:hypothetical protein
MPSRREYLVGAVESALNARHHLYQSGHPTSEVAEDIVKNLESSGWVIAHLDDPVPAEPQLRDVVVALAQPRGLADQGLYERGLRYSIEHPNPRYPAEGFRVFTCTDHPDWKVYSFSEALEHARQHDQAVWEANPTIGWQGSGIF